MEQLTSRAHSIPFRVRDGAQRFRENASLRPVRRHTLIYSSGDEPSHVYLVGHGEVKLSRFSPEGRELTLAIVGPDEVFGEADVLLRRPRAGQAIARSDCVLHLLECEALFALAGREPGFGLWLTQRMGERQARMENRLETLVFHSATGKVAQELLRLAETHGRSTPAGTLIDYPITHQEIGNLIATTRETVSYAFMDFRQRGLISTRRRRTVIHDLDALGDLALS